MLGLLAYPLLFEPLWGTRHADRRVGESATGCCSMSDRHLRCTAAPRTAMTFRRAIDRRRHRGPKGRWTALAFVPSSLMLGVTTHISTDLASIPLLWVLPLAAYLLTFVLVFLDARSCTPAALVARGLPIVVIAARWSRSPFKARGPG